MKKFNMIFPGQGSQKVGMGLDLYKNNQEARLVFEEVNDALGVDLSKIIFEGPDNVLKLTINTQPAIMTTSIAVVRVLEKELNINLPEITEIVLGHSLGEYSALCAIGSLSLNETAVILRARGEAMQDSVEGIDTKMIAVIGMEVSAVEDELNKIDIPQNEVCEIANDNCPGQVILSGSKNILDSFSNTLKEKGARSVIDLNVSAPFHCSLMKKASSKMNEVLSDVNLKRLETKFISNISANFESDLKNIKKLLVDQVFNRVRWRESIMNAEKNGPKKFVELGNGKVLSGMNKRISKGIVSENLFDMKSIDKFIENNKDFI